MLFFNRLKTFTTVFFCLFSFLFTTIGIAELKSDINEQLMDAVEQNNLLEVKSAIKQGADINYKVQGSEHYYYTSLILATSKGHLDIVKYLVKAGADVNIRDNQYNEAKASVAPNLDEYVEPAGHTVLMIPSANGDLDMVQYLVKSGVDINAQNNVGETALMFATRRGGRFDVVRFLVKSGADINSKCAYGTTTLMWASYGGYLDIVRFLVKEGADINHQSDNENTALTWASDKGHLDVVRFLVEEGADINHKSDNGHTALTGAEERGHKDIIEYLKKHGTSKAI